MKPRTAGISVFIYDEDKHIKENELQLNLTETTVNGTLPAESLHQDLREDQQFFWVEMGDIMLFASLIFDGLTGAMQEKIRAQNQEQKQRKIVTPLVMMSTLNSYASIGKIFKCNNTRNLELDTVENSRNFRQFQNIFHSLIHNFVSVIFECS